MRHRLRRIALLGAALTLMASASCGPAATPLPTTLHAPPPAATPAPTSTSTLEPSPTPTELPSPTPLPPTATPMPPTPTPTPAQLPLTSTAFEPGGMIPKRHARRGEDLSPPLSWDDPPPGTQSFALLVFSEPLQDGAGNWVQWLLYNIPAETRALPERVAPDADGVLPDGSQHFENSWGELGYGGPNPPHVSTFRYYFNLYALDAMLDLQAVEDRMREDGTLPWIGVSKAVLEEAMDGHILAQGELVGRYKEEQEPQ